MEPRGGNRSQIVSIRKRLKQAKTVAWLGGVSGSSPSEGSRDVIPICLTAVSSGDDDAAAAVEVFRGRLQEERGHARA
jgi:hypothetical protein